MTALLTHRLTALLTPLWLLLTLAACASGPKAEAIVIGEHAAYLVVNASSEQTIQMPQLIEARSGQILYANLQATRIHPRAPRLSDVRNSRVGSNDFIHDPGDEDLSMPVRIAHSYAPVLTPHRVPDHVLIRWREQALPAQKYFAGRSVEPVKVSLRASIPPDVLALVRNQWRYRLDVAVSVNHKQPTVGWRIVSFNDETPHEIRRGGFWPGE